MTVQELIKELKKLPKNIEVAFKAHDQDEGELDAFINHVVVTDFSEIKPNMWDIDDEVAVLSS